MTPNETTPGFDNFDGHAGTYRAVLDADLKKYGANAAYYFRYKARVLRALGIAPDVLVDFGCGTGEQTPDLLDELTPNRYIGLDVSSESLAVARTRCANHDRVEFRLLDDERLEVFGECDALYCCNVLHHIRPASRERYFRYFRELLSAEGKLIVLEHNPHNPLTRRFVRDCPFDENASLLPPYALRKQLRSLGFSRVRLHFIVFFPPLIGDTLRLDRWFMRLPLGAQYIVIAQP